MRLRGEASWSYWARNSSYLLFLRFALVFFRFRDSNIFQKSLSGELLPLCSLLAGLSECEEGLDTGGEHEVYQARLGSALLPVEEFVFNS